MCNKNAPCLNCEERHELCHKNCPYYKEYRNRLALIKESKKNFGERFVTHYLARVGVNIYHGF